MEEEAGSCGHSSFLQLACVDECRLLSRWIGSGCFVSGSAWLGLKFVGDCRVDGVVALWLR